MLRSLPLLTLLLFALLSWSSAQGTLREVLSSHQLEIAGLSNADLEQPLTSYDLYQDKERALLAGYRDDGSGGLPERLSLWSLERDESRWRLHDLELVTADGRDLSICLGSVVKVDRIGERYLVRTQLTPSATCELILGSDLELRDALFGWVVAHFPDGTLVYHHSQIHFAPVHSVAISLYDPERSSHTQIYPPLPPFQELRQAHLEALTAAFADRGLGWCNANNHPCDPSRFDERLVGRVMVSDNEDALAFVIAFDRSLLEEEGVFQEVAYVYREVRERTVPEYRELELRIPTGRGLDGLEELLTRENLRVHF